MLFIKTNCVLKNFLTSLSFKCRTRSNTTLLQGLYLDERENGILVIEEVKLQEFKRIINLERYTVLREPRSVFINHTSSSSVSAENVTKSFLSCLDELNFHFIN